MKMKRILALVLALTAMFSLTTVSLATGEKEVSGGAGEVKQERSVSLQTPTINVTVNPLAGFVVNPYKIQYTEDVGTQTGVNSADSLITFPGLITNKTNSKLVISATALITPDSGAAIRVLDSYSDLTNESYKNDANVFMFVELRKITSNTAPADGWLAASTNSLGTKKEINMAAAGSASRAATINMDAATNVSTPSYAAYKLGGETSGKGWDSADKFLVNIAFTFTPVAKFPTT